MRKPSKLLVAVRELLSLFKEEDKLWFEAREIERQQKELQGAIARKIEEIQGISWRTRI